MKPVYFVIKDGLLIRVGPKPSSEIEAIDQSIIKYLILEAEAKAGNAVKDGGVGTCGLCLYFKGICAKCTIGSNNREFDASDTTMKYMGCQWTPYQDYYKAYEEGYVDDSELAATAELRLLRRLRRKLESEG
jgi:hypothetical protein